MKDLDMTNQQIQARLDELDAKLDLYKARAKRVSADARAESQEIIAKLTNKRRKAAEQLDQYSKSTGSAMERIGFGLQESLEDLSAAMKEAGSILKN